MIISFILYSQLDQLLLIIDLVINTTVVAIKKLLAAVERTTAIVVRKYLEIGVNDVIVAINIHRRVVAYDSVGCSLIKLPLIVWGVNWQFVLVHMLVELMNHRIGTL